MSDARFRFALRNIESSDWKRFEELASKFLASEFSNLRTMASSSGDGGKDAILLTPSGSKTVVLQYSVAKAWKSKILNTAKRIANTSPETKMLIYVTNQEIGARADAVVGELRNERGIFLDIRDQNWFLERMSLSASNRDAAEELARLVADPIVIREGVAKQSQALTEIEAKAALLFLSLRWEDDTRQKGLTKLSFEALVTSALRHTDSDNRMTRAEIYKRLLAVLSSHPESLVKVQIDSALERMNKSTVRRWMSDDTFCLAHAEVVRIRERLAESDAVYRELECEIEIEVAKYAYENASSDAVGDLTQRVKRILERVLISKGELFVNAVLSERYEGLGADRVDTILTSDFAEFEFIEPKRAGEGAYCVGACVRALLYRPGSLVRQHLRVLVDAYTLLAFLRETVDVQGAVKKMFASGRLWLDTSLVLPLFSEVLQDEEERPFTSVMKAASEAGFGLHVTAGVVEEVAAHMNVSQRFFQLGSNGWEGNVPYLASRFLSSGRPPVGFGSWLETFKGTARPEDDIGAYLSEFHKIHLAGLSRHAQEMPENLRYAVQEAWESLHEARRLRHKARSDANTATRLAKHDIENHLGVMRMRETEKAEPLGFASWWVTLDRGASVVERGLREVYGSERIASPLMSPDFLVNYLAIGPARGRVGRDTEELLPAVLELGMLETIPPDLLAIASGVRQRNSEFPEHVIRRKVRDELDAAKRRAGPLGTVGLDYFEDSSVDV